MWFVRFFSTSIGKKFFMACTGLLLLLFLVLHALGNAAIFFSSKAFQTYANALHGFPVVVFVFGVGLVIIFLVHVILGLQLFLENRKVRNSRYAVDAKIVDNSLASTTMPYSGFFILLFIVIHVFGFGFASEEVLISDLVRDLLSNFYYGLFYLFSFCVLAFHLSHGFWSMLQTFGINHPRYNAAIARLALLVPGFFLIFFGAIALYFMTGLGANY